VCHIVAYRYCDTVSLVFAYNLLFNEHIYKPMKVGQSAIVLTSYSVIAAVL